jgi:hypothetical protein
MMRVRPYHLIEVVSALGGDAASRRKPTIRELIRAVRKEPDRPLTLVCNVGEIYGYQDPGLAEDTPEGPEFNLRRDLEILHKINLFPGATLPARIIFNRIWDWVETLEGICAFSRKTARAWSGWPKARLAAYRRGRRRGVTALIPPRSVRAMTAAKRQSLAAMARAEAIDVRPHILLCSICQYGGGLRPPFAEDNLPELVQLILEKPETRLRLAPHADWMMCAPCPYRRDALNACVNNKGSGGLPNQMRDLRVLQKLGWTFGSVLPARDIYRRVLTRIPGTLEICRLEPARPSVWWTGCGSATVDNRNYVRGRKQWMKLWGLR